MKPQKSSDDPGRYAYDGLDRVIHEKARLGILTSLATHAKGLRFNDLKALCSLTDGNLNRHLQALQEAGLVDVQKDGAGRNQTTTCKITPVGRRRFAEYLRVLEQVVGDAVRAADAPVKTKPAWNPT
ncbi:MAG: transcriptional regulator [Gemmataceae bacterium]